MVTPPPLDALELKIVETALARGWRILRPADSRQWMATRYPPELELQPDTWGPTMKRLPTAVMERLRDRGILEQVLDGAGTEAPAGERYRLAPAALAALHMASGNPRSHLDPSRYPVIGARLGRDPGDGTSWGVASLLTPENARVIAATLAELARGRAQAGATVRMPTLEMDGRLVPFASFQAMGMHTVTPSVWTGHASELFVDGAPHHDLRIRHEGGAYGEPIRILAERASQPDAWTEIGRWREEHLAEALLTSEVGKDPDVGPPLLDAFTDGAYS